MSAYVEKAKELATLEAAILANVNRLKTARAEITTVSANLAGLAQQYQAAIADIDAFADTNRTDVAAQNMKARKDLLVKDFTDFKAAADSMRNALDAL